MKKIYLVSRGEYSDYGIVAVFDSKQKAEKYIKDYNEVYCGKQGCSWDKLNDHVEEIPVNEEIKKEKREYRVCIHIEEETYCTCLDQISNKHLSISKHIDSWKNQLYYYKLYVHTDTYDKAVKIAKDHFYKLLALDQLPTEITE